MTRSSRSESKILVIFFRRAEIVVCLCSASPLCIPRGNSPKDWDRACMAASSSPPLFELKTIWNDALLEVSFSQIQGQIKRVCLNLILLKPKFRKFFYSHELGEGLFFQYLPINQTVNIFFDKNWTDKPLRAECRWYGDFLWMQVLC